MQIKVTGFLYAPQNTEIPKLPLNIGPNWVKLKKKKKKKKKEKVAALMFCKFFVALLIFYIKSTCFKKHLHRRQGQSGFHFLTFILIDEREVQFFIF